MNNLKVGDKVKVIAGDHKGKVANIKKIIRGSECNDKQSKMIVKVVLENVNLKKKHIRPNPQKQQEGGIVEFEAPIHVSNVKRES